jgi:hypothetical protein
MSCFAATRLTPVRGGPWFGDSRLRRGVMSTARIKSATDARKIIGISVAARNNKVRQRAFSERIGELMARYTNQRLTSAGVIAELVKDQMETMAPRYAEQPE